jgi:hypothetical protein
MAELMLLGCDFSGSLWDVFAGTGNSQRRTGTGLADLAGIAYSPTDAVMIHLRSSRLYHWWIMALFSASSSVRLFTLSSPRTPLGPEILLARRGRSR